MHEYDYHPEDEMTMTTQNETTVLLTIPKRFYDNHVWRDLPAGTVIKETARKYTVEVTREELDELLSDARYYSDGAGWSDPQDMRPICASARATVKAIEAVLSTVA